MNYIKNESELNNYNIMSIQKVINISDKINKMVYSAKYSLDKYNTLKTIFESISDNYTQEHSERVSLYSVLIGKKLSLSIRELEILKIGGLFHDIGKIGISESILYKNDALTDEEYAKIKKHPIIGKDILTNISIFQDIIPIVLYHHERYDGKGYPYGISGEDIPFLARIVAVADAFDAITSKRPYRNELSLEYAKKEIKDKMGTQFDPTVGTTFLNILNNDYQSISVIKQSH